MSVRNILTVFAQPWCMNWWQVDAHDFN